MAPGAVCLLRYYAAPPAHVSAMRGVYRRMGSLPRHAFRHARSGTLLQRVQPLPAAQRRSGWHQAVFMSLMLNDMQQRGQVESER